MQNISPHELKTALQEEFDVAVKEWADLEAKRYTSPATFTQSASGSNSDPATVTLGKCEGLKRIAERFDITLANDDLGSERLHNELVNRDIFDY